MTELGQEDALEGVLQAYVDGLRGCFWITASCAIAAFICCLGLEWKSVKDGHGQGAKDVEAEGVKGEEGKLESDIERKETI